MKTYGYMITHVQECSTERLEECRDAIRSLYGFYISEGIDIEDLKDLGNALVAIENILNSRKETK